MKKIKFKKIKIKNKKLLIISLAVVIVLIPTILLLAKYISNQIYIKQATGKEFYFVSSVLPDDGDNYYIINNFNPSESTIKIDLNNYLDEYRKSEADIRYTITGNCISTINDTLEVEDETDNVNISVPSSCFTNNVATINLTVSTKAPYSKTLSGTFELHKGVTEVSYEVFDEEGQNELLLVLNTNGTSGNIILEYPNHLYPDVLDDDYTIDEDNRKIVISNASKNSEYNITFLKDDAEDTYDEDDFNLDN